MRAILMTAVGGPDVLKLSAVPEPQITGEHDVLVRLQAAGINPVDYKLRASGTIGVGHMSVQIARLAGARVATTVSRGPKTEPAKSLGAELCIDYTSADVGANPAPSVFGWFEHRVRQRQILERAGSDFDTGELRVQVGATYPLEQAADAHRALEAGQVIGKVVLVME
jgi:NADPH:quinone reductase-like Zn-dependent oxidoreductase